jgi:hypothetical protein
MPWWAIEAVQAAAFRLVPQCRARGDVSRRADKNNFWFNVR